MGTPVYLEIGAKKVFACSLDFPGWARSARGEDDALAALAANAGRYRPVADAAGVRFPASAGVTDLDVVERVTGDATTDFGAPHVPAGAEPLTAAQAERLASLVAAGWDALDDVVAGAPAELTKGPRGGGRDRDKMVAHVVDAEAAYFHKVGVKGGREDFLAGLRAARRPQPELATRTWPWRYTARRVAWHALDHAWEMQDRRP
ncbi:MAG: hypothetical protein ACR2HM_09315 [Acidimicrobiales bacterium]